MSRAGNARPTIFTLSKESGRDFGESHTQEIVQRIFFAEPCWKLRLLTLHALKLSFQIVADHSNTRAIPYFRTYALLGQKRVDCIA